MFQKILVRVRAPEPVWIFPVKDLLTDKALCFRVVIYKQIRICCRPSPFKGDGRGYFCTCFCFCFCIPPFLATLGYHLATPGYPGGYPTYEISIRVLASLATLGYHLATLGYPFTTLG